MNLSQLKNPIILVITGLVMGVLADILFYGQPLGITVPIAVMLFVTVLVAMTLAEDIPITIANLWLIIPLLFLAIMSAIRAAPLLRVLNIGGSVLLILLLADRLTSPAVTTLNVGGYLRALVEAALVGPFASLPLIQHTYKSLGSVESPNRGTARRVAVGVGIATPFLLIFTALFASADLVFANAIRSIFDSVNIGNVVGHLILTILLACVSMGMFTYAVSRTWAVPLKLLPDPPPSTPSTASSMRGKLGAIEAVVALFSIDALFLIFVAIQFAALFGGEAFLRSQGLTYSAYARRGFFELVAVAVLTLSLILALDYLTLREGKRQNRLFLIGSGLMTLMTIIILISAFQRMTLYELAYGFTRLRVHTHVFMIWLAVLMIVFFVLLMINRTRLLATTGLLTFLGFVITLNLLNPDAFIARQNIARYQEGAELDGAYLASLSEDAIPYLISLLNDPVVDVEIGMGLHSHLEQLDNRYAHAGWQGYHAAIHCAYTAMLPYRDRIEEYPIRLR